MKEITETEKNSIAAYIRSRRNPPKWEDFKTFFQLETEEDEMWLVEVILELIREGRVKLVINKEVVE